MNYRLLLVFLLCIPCALYAQMGSITGRVIDAKTHQPLPFANVYLNNTTIGVTTNAVGEFTLNKLPVGATELVFSFLGYTTQQISLVIKQTADPPLTIALNPDARSVSEVNVKASRDKTWEKQERRFEKVFFNSAAECKLLNPWVLDFAQENGKTTAKSLLPLEIDNQTLGYKLFFQLKNCSYSNTEFAIVGSVRFTEMETANASVAHNWMTNRERAYRGSAKQLMKAILDRRINQQGFLLFQEKDKGKPRGKNFTQERQTNLLPVDTTSFVMPASSS
ncbi:MAG: carboxypeptidase-like regulatory domain-containing protein, partial [Hymenobacter sp.]